MSNLLMLTGAVFMLEVYDRILPSRSVPTLVALLILVAGLYAAQGMIDTIRSRILVRVGHSLDESMSGRVYDAIVRLPLKIGGKAEGTQPIRDLDNVRSFLSGSGPVAFFDLPWMPVYLAICFLFHTLIGLTALFGAIVLVALTIITEIKTRHPTRSAAQFAVARNALLEASRLMPRPLRRWVWSAALPSIGTSSIGISWPAAGGPATSAAGLPPRRRFCVCCCNRLSSRSVRGW
jgi:ATP-binding cassette subfamily C protein